jgi:hypothetical protein
VPDKKKHINPLLQDTRETAVPVWGTEDTPKIEAQQPAQTDQPLAQFSCEIDKGFMPAVNAMLDLKWTNKTALCQEIIEQYITINQELADNPLQDVKQIRHFSPTENVNDLYVRIAIRIPARMVRQMKNISTYRRSKREAFNEAICMYLQGYEEPLRLKGIAVQILPKYPK